MVQAIDQELLNKRLYLVDILSKMDRVIIAYSGGVDSAFLAAGANEVLGNNALSVTAVSPSLAPSELEEAQSLAQDLGLNYRIINHDSKIY